MNSFQIIKEQVNLKIGYRTIKTAIGTPIAISLAQFMGLTNFVTAGILTMLCIQPSRKQSVMSAWHRFLACVIASIFSFVFFEGVGYNTFVVGLMLAVFIPTTVWLKITQGITTSSVIIINLYGAQHMSYTFLFDQFLLIIVGIGIGLLVNLYMPSMDKQLNEKQKQLEEDFQVILHEIALYIRDKNMNWTGKELLSAEDTLTKALKMVERDRENHMLRTTHSYYNYFNMRSKQLDLLRKMLPLVTKLPEKDHSISERIAGFFDRLSKAVHPGNTAVLFLEQLRGLRKDFDQLELPATQEEFETRANLYRLLHELESYLKIKQKFKKSDVKQKIKKTGTIG